MPVVMPVVIPAVMPVFAALGTEAGGRGSFRSPGLHGELLFHKEKEAEASVAAFRRWRQKDWKFKVTLNHGVSLRPLGPGRPSLNNKKSSTQSCQLFLKLAAPASSQPMKDVLSFLQICR